MADEKCPFCGSDRTYRFVGYTDEKPIELPFRYQECANGNCLLPCRLWQQIAELKAALAEREKRIKHLEGCCDCDLQAAQSLVPGISSVGSMSVVIGARFREQAEEFDRFQRSLGKELFDMFAKVTALEATLAKRMAEIESLKIQNAYLLGEHEKIRQFLFDFATRSESLCTCAELRAEAWAVETRGESDASQ